MQKPELMIKQILLAQERVVKRMQICLHFTAMHTIWPQEQSKRLAECVRVKYLNYINKAVVFTNKNQEALRGKIPYFQK